MEGAVEVKKELMSFCRTGKVTNLFRKPFQVSTSDLKASRTETWAVEHESPRLGSSRKEKALEASKQYHFSVKITMKRHLKTLSEGSQIGGIQEETDEKSHTRGQGGGCTVLYYCTDSLRQQWAAADSFDSVFVLFSTLVCMTSHHQG